MKASGHKKVMTEDGVNETAVEDGDKNRSLAAGNMDTCCTEASYWRHSAVGHTYNM